MFVYFPVNQHTEEQQRYSRAEHAITLSTTHPMGSHNAVTMDHTPNGENKSMASVPKESPYKCSFRNFQHSTFD